jgi:hypothetical protein
VSTARKSELAKAASMHHRARSNSTGHASLARAHLNIKGPVGRHRQQVRAGAIKAGHPTTSRGRPLEQTERADCITGQRTRYPARRIRNGALDRSIARSGRRNERAGARVVEAGCRQYLTVWGREVNRTKPLKAPPWSTDTSGLVEGRVRRSQPHDLHLPAPGHEEPGTSWRVARRYSEDFRSD